MKSGGDVLCQTPFSDMSPVKIGYDQRDVSRTRTVIFGFPGAIEPLGAAAPHVKLHSLPVELLLHDEFLVWRTNQLCDGLMG